jgi:hypothetical protein
MENNPVRIVNVEYLSKLPPDLYDELADLLLTSLHKYGMMTKQEELQFLLNTRTSILLLDLPPSFSSFSQR